MKVAEPKACVDVMLGAIALLSRTRTLDEYVDGDMVERGQTPERQRVPFKLLPRPGLLPLYTWTNRDCCYDRKYSLVSY
jgi:hypothetical protein